MAPAAYHRIVYEGEDTEELQRVGGWMITTATLPLAAGLAGDVFVVIEKIAGSNIGIAAAAGTLTLLFGLWYGYPLIVRRFGRLSPSRDQRSRPQGQSG